MHVPPQRVILFIDNSRMSIWMVISITRDLEHQTGHGCPNALAILVSYAYPLTVGLGQFRMLSDHGMLVEKKKKALDDVLGRRKCHPARPSRPGS